MPATYIPTPRLINIAVSEHTATINAFLQTKQPNMRAPERLISRHHHLINLCHHRIISSHRNTITIIPLIPSVKKPTYP